MSPQADTLKKACESLVAIKERGYALAARNADLARADRLTGAALDEWLAVAAELEEACEQVRREHFPRRKGQVFCAQGDVMIASPTGRRTQLIYTREAGLLPT